MSHLQRALVSICRLTGIVTWRITVLLGALCLAGCYHSYAPVRVADAESAKAYQVARITTTDGRVVVLDSVSVRTDSIVGYSQARPPGRAAFSRADVRSLEMKAFDPGRIVIATVAVVMLLAWMATEIGKDMPDFNN